MGLAETSEPDPRPRVERRRSPPAGSHSAAIPFTPFISPLARSMCARAFSRHAGCLSHSASACAGSLVYGNHILTWPTDLFQFVDVFITIAIA
jgi:hypothetical protein